MLLKKSSHVSNVTSYGTQSRFLPQFMMSDEWHILDDMYCIQVQVEWHWQYASTCTWYLMKTHVNSEHLRVQYLCSVVYYAYTPLIYRGSGCPQPCRLGDFRTAFNHLLPGDWEAECRASNNSNTSKPSPAFASALVECKYMYLYRYYVPVHLIVSTEQYNMTHEFE